MTTLHERDAAYMAALTEARSELDPAFDQWIIRTLQVLAGDYDFFRHDVKPLFTVRDWMSLSSVRGANARAGVLLDLLVWRNFCREDFRSLVRGGATYKFIELLDLHFWHRINEDGGLANASIETLRQGYWKRAYFWSNKFIHANTRGIVEELFKNLRMDVRNDDDWPDEIDMGPQTWEQKHDFASLALRVTIPGEIELLEKFLVPFATKGIEIGVRPAGVALTKTFPSWVADEKDLGRIGFDPLVTESQEWTLEFAAADAPNASAFELEGGGPLRLRKWTWSANGASRGTTVALGGIQARQPNGNPLEPLQIYPMMHAIDVETMMIALGGIIITDNERITFDEPELERYNEPEYDDHFRAMLLVIEGGEYSAIALDPFTRFKCFAMAPDYEFLLALPDAGWLVAFDEIMREPASQDGRKRDILRRDGKLVFWKCSLCASAEVAYTDLDSGHMYCCDCRRVAPVPSQ